MVSLDAPLHFNAMMHQWLFHAESSLAVFPDKVDPDFFCDNRLLTALSPWLCVCAYSSLIQSSVRVALLLPWVSHGVVRSQIWRRHGR